MMVIKLENLNNLASMCKMSFANTYWSVIKTGNVKMISWAFSFWANKTWILFVLDTEEVGDEGEEEKECITYNVSIDIHYGIKSNR